MQYALQLATVDVTLSEDIQGHNALIHCFPVCWPPGNPPGIVFGDKQKSLKAPG